jgi:hypothetical protein
VQIARSIRRAGFKESAINLKYIASPDRLPTIKSQQKFTCIDSNFCCQAASHLRPLIATYYRFKLNSEGALRPT